MANVGDIVEGKVTGITSFGAFIHLEDGLIGLVHISEVAEGYVKDIKDHLTEGQVIKAKIISVEKDGRLRLSIKKLNSSPARQTIEKRNIESKNGEPYNNKRISQNYSKPAEYQNAQQESSSFEDKLLRFMKDSDEKLSDLKRQTDNKRGGGYGRKSNQY